MDIISRHLFIALTMVISTIYTPAASAQSDAPIVVELFTSIGCPACPPADRIFGELAKHDNIIALGCHVSYFNRDNWRDKFSQEFCDIRQHGYAGMSGGKKIYTPQMIVNGGKGFIGSHKDEVDAAIKSAQNNPIKTIKIDRTSDGTISFTLPKSTQGKYRLWTYGYKKDIAYANPLSSYTNLGSWQGIAITKTLKIENPDISGIAILAQDGGYGDIIAAGKVEF